MGITGRESLKEEEVLDVKCEIKDESMETEDSLTDHTEEGKAELGNIVQYTLQDLVDKNAFNELFLYFQYYHFHVTSVNIQQKQQLN